MQRRVKIQVLNHSLVILVVMQVDRRFNPNAELTGSLSTYTRQTRRTLTGRGSTNARRLPSTPTQRNQPYVPRDEVARRCSLASDLYSDDERSDDLSWLDNNVLR